MNEKIIHCLFIIVCLFASLPVPVYATEVLSQIIRSLEPNSITIIGETHRRPQSIKFFHSLISTYLQQNKCLVVALEIASNQQAMLDEIMRGKAAVSAIEIPSMIDHPSFRALIDNLAKMKTNGDCLKLIAIDVGLEISTGRDEWMAKNLADQINQIPILALLGNLHTLKKVNWNLSMTKVSPYVAEILASQDHRIKTYPQIWMDKTCNARNRLIPSDKGEALRIINSRLIKLLNAFEYKMVHDVIDGVVIWECG